MVQDAGNGRSLFRSRIEAAKEPDEPESKEKRYQRIEEQYRHIFDQTLQEATRLGIAWGPIRAADSVHTVANLNNEKDRIRQERGLPSADPDATVVNRVSFREASRKRLVPAWA